MISWKEYWTLMSLGLLFYYGWMLFKYFPGLKPGGRAREMLRDFHFREPQKAGKTAPAKGEERVEERPSDPVLKKPEEVQPVQAPQSGQLKLPLPEEKTPERSVERPVNLGQLAEGLADELKALIGQAAKDKQVKGEITFNLQRLLDKDAYRALRGTYFEEKINELIGSAVVNECSIHLDALELSGLWIR